MKILEYELIKCAIKWASTKLYWFSDKWYSQPLVVKRIEVCTALVGFCIAMLLDIQPGKYYFPLAGAVLIVSFILAIAGLVLWGLWNAACNIIRRLDL
jgi:hypothetical protein